MIDQKVINEKIDAAEKKLAELDEKRAELKEYIARLRNSQDSITSDAGQHSEINKNKITNESQDEEKIALFRSLFCGREDVFPKRFESKRTQKSGYQPVCRNEWIRPFCKKTKN